MGLIELPMVQNKTEKKVILVHLGHGLTAKLQSCFFLLKKGKHIILLNRFVANTDTKQLKKVSQNCWQIEQHNFVKLSLTCLTETEKYFSACEMQKQWKPEKEHHFVQKCYFLQTFKYYLCTHALAKKQI